MKIGKLVKVHIRKVFQYCETTNHDELGYFYTTPKKVYFDFSVIRKP